MFTQKVTDLIGLWFAVHKDRIERKELPAISCPYRIKPFELVYSKDKPFRPFRQLQLGAQFSAEVSIRQFLGTAGDDIDAELPETYHDFVTEQYVADTLEYIYNNQEQARAAFDPFSAKKMLSSGMLTAVSALIQTVAHQYVHGSNATQNLLQLSKIDLESIDHVELITGESAKNKYQNSIDQIPDCINVHRGKYPCPASKPMSKEAKQLVHTHFGYNPEVVNKQIVNLYSPQIALTLIAVSRLPKHNLYLQEQAMLEY